MDAEPRALAGDSAAKALYGLAAESPDAILVLSSSHRGAVGQVMSGSVVEPMLHGSRCPVAFAPRRLARSSYDLRVLGVAYDDSAEARAAFRDAIHEAAAGLPQEVRALPVVCRGNPLPELLSQCQQGVDLLLMGSRGYGPVRSVLLGSTSSMMIRAARCPVIVLPRPRKRARRVGAEAQPPA